MTLPDIDVAVVGGGPKGVSVALRLKRRGVHALTMFERSTIVGTWDSALAGTSPVRTGMFLSDTITPGDSEVPPLWEFARSRISAEEYESDDLPKKLLQAYYATVMSASGIHVETSTAVGRVSPMPGRAYRLTLADGRTVTARRVVDATGIVHSKRWPEWVDQLPADTYWHSIGHGVLKNDGRRRLLVVGGGHATPDIAVRMAELGSDVTVVIRRGPLRQQMLPYAQQFLTPAFQDACRAASTRERLAILRRVTGAGPWVTPRSYRDLVEAIIHPREGMGRIEVAHRTTVERVLPVAGQVRVECSNGWRRTVEGIICATGFHAALPKKAAYAVPDDFWHGRCLGGYPLLEDDYSVYGHPGFHVVGYLAQLGPRGPVDSILHTTQTTSEVVARAITGSLCASRPARVPAMRTTVPRGAPE